ncbi:hypothetical protein LTR10_021792 [Elasticomyces elasticus]|uniref:F-box domain-containing protein n=1 Tax=Exophiala sideris TaxID=1016849 RepID=A0ABR0J617_9EURO|nr:hypothetical protein LTR10_021792 [Elasticomyces elasticus]KAK5028732.1 hypothetical protein LTS07_006111 [Exophiala sideris]KAK5035600.1 hypothetical protein LTR13_005729 [Exophiala sideris]KAK5057236.1 hypothetical protein LTR69_007275 [Exophiala sideris]KAK5181791.1 hypothetical protein LTR44_005991 [Eurotiomycetes sp. CCFEE 6388]
MKPEISKVRKRKRATQKGQTRVPESWIPPARVPAKWIHPARKPPVQKASAHNINELPRELLVHILQQLRQSSHASRDGSFLNALTTCSLWHDIGREITWTDICITNTSLPKFSNSKGSDLELTRSLTLSFHTRTPMPNHAFAAIQAREIPLPRVHEVQTMMPQTLELWKHLDKLPAMVEKMKALESFSLVISSPEGGLPGFYINHHQIRALLDAMPATVRHLELDTEGFWDCKESYAENHHVCPAIRRLSPRLKSLRLRMRWLCESLVPVSTFTSDQVSNNHSADAIKDSSALYPRSSASRSTAFVINTTGPFEDTRQLHCSLLHQDLFQAHGLFMDYLVAALRKAISEGRLRQFWTCSIITLLDAASSVHGSENRSALQSNTVFATLLLPYEAQCKFPALSGYGRYGPKPEHRRKWSAIRHPNQLKGAIDVEQVAPRRQISSVVEGGFVGGVWRPLLTGLRDPNNVFIRGTTVGWGHYKPLQPIWEMEDACGTRLLRSEKSDQLDDFQLLARDLTPREKICRQRKEARKRGLHVPYDAFYDDVELPDSDPADGDQATANQADENEDVAAAPTAAASLFAGTGENDEQNAADATTHDTSSFDPTHGADDIQDASRSESSSAGEANGGENAAHEEGDTIRSNHEDRLPEGNEESHAAEDTEVIDVHSGEAWIRRSGDTNIVSNGRDEILRQGEKLYRLRSGEHTIMFNEGEFVTQHSLTSGQNSILVTGDDYALESGHRCITTSGDRFNLESEIASIKVGYGTCSDESKEHSITQDYGKTVMRSGKLYISYHRDEYLVKYDGQIVAKGPVSGDDEPEKHDTGARKHNFEPEKHNPKPQKHDDLQQSLTRQVETDQQGAFMASLSKRGLFVISVVGSLILRICLTGTLVLLTLAILWGMVDAFWGRFWKLMGWHTISF